MSLAQIITIPYTLFTEAIRCHAKEVQPGYYSLKTCVYTAFM